MLGELLAAGLASTIAGGIKDKAQVRRAKQHADEYFKRTNAERAAVEQAHRERMNKILERYAKEDQERAERQQAGEQEPEQEQRTESGTIHIDNISFTTSSNTADSADFEKIFKDFEKNFE